MSQRISMRNGAYVTICGQCTARCHAIRPRRSRRGKDSMSENYRLPCLANNVGDDVSQLQVHLRERLLHAYAALGALGCAITCRADATAIVVHTSSRSGGTATKWDALPMSIPAAFGWVMLSAVCFARIGLCLCLTPALRCAIVCSIIKFNSWRRFG
jgi:hypothetical protein